MQVCVSRTHVLKRFLQDAVAFLLTLLRALGTQENSQGREGLV